MKKNLLAGIIFLIFVLQGIFLPALFVYGQTVTPTSTPSPTPNDSDQRLKSVQDRIKELEGKVVELDSQDKTLSSQIEVMDNQIELTQLRIGSTKQQISEVTKDIATASKRITNLESSLNTITKVLINRIIASYKAGTVPPAEYLVSSKTLADYFQRSNYIRLAQKNDKRMLYDTQQARNDYQNQKDIFESKKRQILSLQTELESYNKQIEQEKKNKEDLLRVTRNDEAKYQSLLASARAEKNAIEGVISSIQLANGAPIAKGQVIAQVGNSGAPYCSTGAHLHFEIRVGGVDVNPAGYLKSGTNWGYNYDQIDYYGVVNPTGDWDWPLDETIKVNQGYGSHGFAKTFYSDGIHHGIDMISESSTLVRAPKDGTLYKGSTSCSGVPMNYVAIDHGGGVVSWYWHVR
jgi:peptidoglycan hydrolase CwlO-like protein